VSEEDDLKSFIAGLDAFEGLGHADRVRLFAWLQFSLRKKVPFFTKDINRFCEKLDYKPGNSSQLSLISSILT
jgi:hypothetical protein